MPSRKLPPKHKEGPIPGRLKTWVVKRVGVSDPGSGDWLATNYHANITCPGCNASARVVLDSWLAASEYHTRPCTYCFNTAKIPEDLCLRPASDQPT